MNFAARNQDGRPCLIQTKLHGLTLISGLCGAKDQMLIGACLQGHTISFRFTRVNPKYPESDQQYAKRCQKARAEGRKVPKPLNPTYRTYSSAKNVEQFYHFMRNIPKNERELYENISMLASTQYKLSCDVEKYEPISDTSVVTPEYMQGRENILIDSWLKQVNVTKEKAGQAPLCNGITIEPRDSRMVDVDGHTTSF